MQQDFIKGLEAIRNAAAIKNGTIQVADILAAFPGVELEDEQISLIYSFLEQEGITLAEYEPHDVNTVGVDDLAREAWGGSESQREQQLFDMYWEDLAAVPPLGREEEEALLLDLLGGEAELRRLSARRLTEGNLRWVVQIARQHSGKGITLADLIQEGNLALWESIQRYDGSVPLEAQLEKDIRGAMKALIREKERFERREQDMAILANRVLEAVRELEAELDRPVSPGEIARHTGLSPEKVEEVLRESAKAIKNEEK